MLEFTDIVCVGVSVCVRECVCVSGSVSVGVGALVLELTWAQAFEALHGVILHLLTDCKCQCCVFSRIC